MNTTTCNGKNILENTTTYIEKGIDATSTGRRMLISGSCYFAFKGYGLKLREYLAKNGCEANKYKKFRYAYCSSFAYGSGAAESLVKTFVKALTKQHGERF